VHAIGRIQTDAFAVGLFAVINHFIDICRAEILAGAAKFFHAAGIADVCVLNYQMCRLVFLMLGAGVVEIGQLVESKLSVALRRTEQVSFVAAIGAQVGQLPHVLIAGRSRVSAAQTSSPG
jgi:hypothetical protein